MKIKNHRKFVKEITEFDKDKHIDIASSGKIQIDNGEAKKARRNENIN